MRPSNKSQAARVRDTIFLLIGAVFACIDLSAVSAAADSGIFL
jgi:hypothetical protein